MGTEIDDLGQHHGEEPEGGAADQAGNKPFMVGFGPIQYTKCAGQQLQGAHIGNSPQVVERVLSFKYSIEAVGASHQRQNNATLEPGQPTIDIHFNLKAGRIIGQHDVIHDHCRQGQYCHNGQPLAAASPPT